MSKILTIVIAKEAGVGRTYIATIEGVEICRSDTPLFTAGKILVEEGLDRNTTLHLWHVNADHAALQCNAGYAHDAQVDRERAGALSRKASKQERPRMPPRRAHGKRRH